MFRQSVLLCRACKQSHTEWEETERMLKVQHLGLRVIREDLKIRAVVQPWGRGLRGHFPQLRPFSLWPSVCSYAKAYSLQEKWGHPLFLHAPLMKCWWCRWMRVNENSAIETMDGEDITTTCEILFYLMTTLFYLSYNPYYCSIRAHINHLVRAQINQPIKLFILPEQTNQKCGKLVLTQSQNYKWAHLCYLWSIKVV